MRVTSAIQWLKISERRVEHHQIDLSLKGPLYAASAVFSRQIKNEDWAVRASVKVSLPLKKKWTASVEAVGSLAGREVSFSHEELASSRLGKLAWTLKSQILELQLESGLVTRATLPSEAVVVSSADLFFAVQDCWSPLDSVRCVLAVAGKKIFAVVMESAGPDRIVGAVTPVALPATGANWSEEIVQAMQSRLYPFEMQWDEKARRLTQLAVKAPVVGMIRVPIN